MRKLLIAPGGALFIAYLFIGGTVRGQTTAAPTPTLVATRPPPPPPGPGPISTQGINPPPPPCPPKGCPTATPVATATPLPTATPVPLTLRVKLAHASVKPRQKQVITVSAAAGTSIYVGVTFPNGDSKSVDTMVGASGHYRFSYTQPGSRITHASRSAVVQVYASLGVQFRESKKRYTIGFAALDVSALPRNVKRGRSISIWVHTAPLTRFGVTLRFARPFASGGGINTTGADGWHLIRTTIPKSAPPGRVDVRANARVGGRNIGGETSFRAH